MDDRILLNPDSRFLGSSPASDFSLYGGQPTPTVTIAPADQSAHDDPLLSKSLAGVAGRTEEGDVPTREASDTGFESDPASPAGGTPATSTAAPVPAPAAETPPPSQVPTSELAQANPSGGSLWPIPAEKPAIVPQASDLADATGATGPGAPPAASGLIAPSIPAEIVNQVAATPVHALSEAHVLSAVASPASQLIDDTANAAANLTAPVLSTPPVDAADAIASVEPLVSVVQASASSVTSEAETTQAVAEDATATVTSIGENQPLSVVSAEVAEAGDEASDAGIQDLLGNDPVAGIATLVSLVSVTDMFDLNHAGDADEPLDGASTSMLDTLAADVPAESALLGDHDQDGSGSLDTHDATDGLGLGG